MRKGANGVHVESPNFLGILTCSCNSLIQILCVKGFQKASSYTQQAPRPVYNRQSVSKIEPGADQTGRKALL